LPHAAPIACIIAGKGQIENQPGSENRRMASLTEQQGSAVQVTDFGPIPDFS